MQYLVLCMCEFIDKAGYYYFFLSLTQQKERKVLNAFLMYNNNVKTVVSRPSVCSLPFHATF